MNEPHTVVSLMISCHSGCSGNAPAKTQLTAESRMPQTLNQSAFGPTLTASQTWLWHLVAWGWALSYSRDLFWLLNLVPTAANSFGEWSVEVGLLISPIKTKASHKMDLTSACRTNNPMIHSLPTPELKIGQIQRAHQVGDPYLGTTFFSIHVYYSTSEILTWSWSMMTE